MSQQKPRNITKPIGIHPHLHHAWHRRDLAVTSPWPMTSPWPRHDPRWSPPNPSPIWATQKPNNTGPKHWWSLMRICRMLKEIDLGEGLLWDHARRGIVENGEELSRCHRRGSGWVWVQVGLAKWAEERVVIVVVANVGRRMVFGSKERREQMRKRERRRRREQK